MKKWHMESIVDISGGNQKLVLPEHTRIEFENAPQTEDEEKEFFFVPIVRTIVGTVSRLL